MKYYNRAVYIDEISSIILTDTHIGYSKSSSLNFQSEEKNELTNSIEELLFNFPSAEKLIISGDIFHNFEKISEKSESTIRRIGEIASENDTELNLIEGNHDTYKLSDIKYNDYSEIKIGEYTILHGDKTPETESKYYITGHIHPTVKIQSHKYPCYLYGESVYNHSNILILPAFNKSLPGTPVNSITKTNSPFINKTNLQEYTVTVWDDSGKQSMKFPKLKDLGEFI